MELEHHGDARVPAFVDFPLEDDWKALHAGSIDK
jgi:hypothetical protein